MRAAVVVELDVEVGEVALVRRLHLGDQLLLAAAFLAGADHDRRAVRVVGADVDAAVAAQLLEPDPDVGLDVLDQVADVDVPVGVGQGGGDEDATHDGRITCGGASWHRRLNRAAAKWPLASAETHGNGDWAVIVARSAVIAGVRVRTGRELGLNDFANSGTLPAPWRLFRTKQDRRLKTTPVQRRLRSPAGGSTDASRDAIGRMLTTPHELDPAD